ATAGFSYQFDINEVIMLNHNEFKINDTCIEAFSLPNILNGLNKYIHYKNTNDFPQYERPQSHNYELSDQPLTQETYFNMMQDFLQQDDILIAEQGTSFFGAYDLALYKDNTFIGQPLWGSIGYTLPATLGTQIANPYRRNILLIGDGSLQLTVQSLSTMIRQNLNPVIFVINNDG
ncbi:thiamine pyrophosphate-dependent enzyme, partial [Staphylococcus aureus]